VFYTKHKENNHIKELLTSWYYNHAQVRFQKQFELTLKAFKNRIKNIPELEIR